MTLPAMNRSGVVFFVCIIVCLPGCAAKRRTSFSQRFINPGKPPVEIGKPPELPKDSIETYAGKARHVAASRGPLPALLATIETRDSTLAAGLLELAAFPDPAHHRRVAERYRQLGILDAAYDHFARATLLDSSDAAAYEGLARIWRDWGFPHLGLGDASRAVYYAPSWPAAHNTLGTLLAAVGHRAEARREYASALALEPRAAYALNNLCYLSFLAGEPAKAIAECRAALAIDPGLAAARNNMALAYAAAGRLDVARRELLASGDAATGLYNTGIMSLAERDYIGAVEAFDAAGRVRPAWAAARARARQARDLTTTIGRSAP